MYLNLKRFSFNKESTGGLLFINGDFECYTVEDQKQEAKVYGETAIWRGTYPIELRTEGMFHQRYLQKYGPQFHKGMLHIKDVLGFEYIYFHPGNNDDDTEGCILVGNTIQTAVGLDMIPPGKTRVAYEQMYPKVRDAIIGGETVLLHVNDITL